jgi:hypothetical protein
MKASDFLNNDGGGFIRKEDLERNGDHEAVIDAVETAEFVDSKTGKRDRKLQLLLTDGLRHTLNRTNTEVLQRHLGDECEGWPGRAVVFTYDETVQYAGRTVGGIRVRVPRRP